MKESDLKKLKKFEGEYSSQEDFFDTHYRVFRDHLESILIENADSYNNEFTAKQIRKFSKNDLFYELEDKLDYFGGGMGSDDEMMLNALSTISPYFNVNYFEWGNYFEVGIYYDIFWKDAYFELKKELKNGRKKVSNIRKKGKRG